MTSTDRPIYYLLFPYSGLYTALRYRLVCFLLNSLFVGTSVAGDIMNTSDNAILCYSCVATPPQYANVDTDELAEHLYSAALDPTTNQTIQLPEINAGCRETHVSGQGQFLGTTKFICQTGACVKLKGHFQGETFVIRECWDRLWERKYDGKWHGCAPVKFLAETHTEICVCSDDLCNEASSMHKTFAFAILCTLMLSACAFSSCLRRT